MRNIFFSILMVFLSSVIPYKIYSDSNIDENILRKDIKSFFSSMSNEEINTLIEFGMVERFPASSDDFRLIPDISSKREILENKRNIRFNVATESLFFIPYRNKDGKKNALFDSFRVTTNIEKLEGIKYFSVSNNEDRILFDRVEILSGRVSYPITKVPTSHTITARIRDSVFGSNRYKIEYDTSSGFLVMRMSNTERLSLGFVPAVARGSLMFHIIIIPGEEGLFLYCSGIGRTTVGNNFITRRITQSVYNRIIALYNWFYESYNDL
ncbi:MAG: hypothetical protein FWC36_09105 [Spirochaetes bacterium]|nr:hypothetical protein [Spirochaetota bacterium]